MATLVLQDLDLERWAQPYLQRLCAECGETVDLAVLDGEQVVYLQVVESSQRVKLAAAVGQRLPAFCTASGKAFMAYLPDEQVNKILSTGLTRYTDNTRVSLEELRDELQLTRQRGFAISEQEYEKDIHAVAAPILNDDSYPLMVIAIVGPSFRMPHERMMVLGQSIQAAIETITREVGLVALSVIASKTSTTGLAG
jgi:DNA-binding IclR family transcriptional regulator